MKGGKDDCECWVHVSGPSDRSDRHYFLFYTCHFLVKTYFTTHISLSLYLEIPQVSPSPSQNISLTVSFSIFLTISTHLAISQPKQKKWGGARNNSLRVPLLKKKLPKNSAILRGNGKRCLTRKLHVQTANKPRWPRPVWPVQYPIFSALRTWWPYVLIVHYSTVYKTNNFLKVFDCLL